MDNFDCCDNSSMVFLLLCDYRHLGQFAQANNNCFNLNDIKIQKLTLRILRNSFTIDELKGDGIAVADLILGVLVSQMLTVLGKAKGIDMVVSPSKCKQDILLKDCELLKNTLNVLNRDLSVLNIARLLQLKFDAVLLYCFTSVLQSLRSKLKSLYIESC